MSEDPLTPESLASVEVQPETHLTPKARPLTASPGLIVVAAAGGAAAGAAGPTEEEGRRPVPSVRRTSPPRAPSGPSRASCRFRRRRTPRASSSRRRTNYLPSPKDPLVPRELINRESLEAGALIAGFAVDGNRPVVRRIETIEGLEPGAFRQRPAFNELISIDPNSILRLETEPDEMCGRVVDLLAPIGRGQRCLIVAPPKAGKTTLLKRMAHAVEVNDPDVHVIVLLIDERPEEITDFRRSVTRGEVIASSADLSAENHIAVAEIVAERARRLIECGKHVIIFLDSITRMARAYNHMQKGGGKIMSGGIDARTMEKPRRFFGAARNAEGGGSLTIVATALVDTGSRMDEIIFQEFKGTGNTEIVLDRDLFNRRIFPCINIPQSGTRKEEKLYGADDLPKIVKLRRALAAVDKIQAMELVLGRLSKFRTNAEFLKSF